MEQTSGNEEAISGVLVGAEIVAVELTDGSPPSGSGWPDEGPTGRVRLADGRVLFLWGNNGCGGCRAGWYKLTELHGASGVITSVRVEERPNSEEACVTCGRSMYERNTDCDHMDRGWYRVFVVVTGGERLLASFEGSDGNGYYGTGWWLTVSDGDLEER